MNKLKFYAKNNSKVSIFREKISEKCMYVYKNMTYISLISVAFKELSFSKLKDKRRERPA